MRNGKRIGIVIPAHDEERAIGLVIEAIPAWADDIVVADNGSHDGTAAAALHAGARVVSVPERGYGAACLAGIATLTPCEIVVFLDGDRSDYPEDMADLVDPIATGACDFVIGSRVLGQAEPGALTPQQRYGNRLATTLIRLIWRARFTDLGPFRAIARDKLEALEMSERTFGWTVEMQIKAAQAGLRCVEAPVRYRRRIGVSKISGTVSGVIKAGTKILAVIARAALRG